MIKGVNHLGVVVKSIDEVVAFLKETFGAEEVKRIEFPELKQISAIVRIGDGCLELMEPTAPDGAVGRYLDAKLPFPKELEHQNMFHFLQLLKLFHYPLSSTMSDEN